METKQIINGLLDRADWILQPPRLLGIGDSSRFRARAAKHRIMRFRKA